MGGYSGFSWLASWSSRLLIKFNDASARKWAFYREMSGDLGMEGEE
jgi:hypothetical protein